MMQHTCRTSRSSYFQLSMIVLGAMLIAGLSQSAVAAPLCVSQSGAPGCYTTIGEAVAVAMPNSTILVAQGTYAEDVEITKPVTLIGANAVINASNQNNGIYIDGMGNPGLRNVVVTGFTVKGADYEGILVTNATSVTVEDNQVLDNDVKFSGGSCSGLNTAEPFDTMEGNDCGQGIHLIDVNHSTVAGNTVTNNAGGILLSDETGPTFDNLIVGNTVEDNAEDCGITLASHTPYNPDATSPFGVFDNTIADNVSNANGTSGGGGAGVGLFSPITDGRVSGNVVTGNKLTNNGHPGVSLHAHGPNMDLNDNVITENWISGNGEDTGQTATSGPTGINVFGVSNITGTVISHNTINNETEDIVVNTDALVKANLNNLLGGNGTYGVYNAGSGTVNATKNWWGCAGGPASGASGCSTESGSVSFAPWLRTLVP